MADGSFFRWFFRDRRTGRITVAQWPNLPLSLFGVAAVLALAASGSTVGFWADLASRLFLLWWAADELLRGVNPWRRCLGAGVLAWLVTGLLR